MYKLGKRIFSHDDFGWHQNISFNNYMEVEDFLLNKDCDKDLIDVFYINVGKKTLYITKDIEEFITKITELTRSEFNVYKGLYGNDYNSNRLNNKEYHIFSVALK